MRKEQFCEIMGDIDQRYVAEARSAEIVKAGSGWVKWLAAAACLCLLLCVGAAVKSGGAEIMVPSPKQVEIPNPVISVASLEEMEGYLDFEVPVLDKDVREYAVYTHNRYPCMGEINYADGSSFRIIYGSGDISGIYGGSLVQERKVGDVQVKYMEYHGDGNELSYALWEQDGFAFCYTMADENDDGAEELIKIFDGLCN